MSTVTFVSPESHIVGSTPETDETAPKGKAKKGKPATAKSKATAKAKAKKPRRRKTPKLSRKARCRINKANASRSTGPRKSHGKLISSSNATTHGLCIENFALLKIEDKQIIRERLDYWKS